MGAGAGAGAVSVAGGDAGAGVSVVSDLLPQAASVRATAAAKITGCFIVVPIY